MSDKALSASSSEDISVITRLVLRERQGHDRGWWDQMAAAYWPDSTVHLTWYRGDGPGFVAGSKDVSAPALVRHRDLALDADTEAVATALFTLMPGLARDAWIALRLSFLPTCIGLCFRDKRHEGGRR
ncbi:hypothetical protein ACAG26_01415 [Mycobacterium sp. pUA109]|uniref:hypothetical protein n=1 Tax=Mycobacterium sp. pUA109 TaxID=3238982 RepID=UPI00351B86DD